MPEQLHVCSINMTEYLNFNDRVKDILQKNNEFTIIQNKVISLLWALKYAPTDGVIAEFGAYKGGNGYLFSKMRPNQRVLLLDTWTGTPDCVTDGLDDCKPGSFNDAPLDDVKKSLAGCTNIEYIQGEFRDNFKELQDTKFAFAFIDSDLYLSTKEVLQFLKGRIVPGGIIIIDDYNQKDCRGVKKAIHEEIPVLEIIGLQNGSLAAWQNLAYEDASCPSQSEDKTESQPQT